MLLKFTAENVLSFKDKVNLDLTASPIKELKDTNIMKINRKQILKSAVIYGPNASGKTNLLLAIQRMWHIVLRSVQEERATNVLPFKLDNNSENLPSLFEIAFMVEEKIYLYKFKVYKGNVVEEYLSEKACKPRAREKMVFNRKNGEFDFDNEFKKNAEILKDKTRANALFLSVAAQFNDTIAENIINWFKKMSFGYSVSLEKTAEKMVDENFKSKVKTFFKNADISITNIFTVDENTNMPNVDQNPTDENIKKKKMSIRTEHNKYDTDGNIIGATRFGLGLESEGTKKLFELSLPIINTLEVGGVLVIDEIDCQLHPLITKNIVKAFNAANNKYAQLICTCHDTSLLSKELFRRDQIWFTEKDKVEATKLYSLFECKINNGKVRNYALYEKEYLVGRYGAIPNVSNKDDDFFN
jgi:Predicted ATPases